MPFKNIFYYKLLIICTISINLEKILFFNEKFHIMNNQYMAYSTMLGNFENIKMQKNQL